MSGETKFMLWSFKLVLVAIPFELLADLDPLREYTPTLRLCIGIIHLFFPSFLANTLLFKYLYKLNLFLNSK